MSQHLSKGEFDALKILPQNKQVVIQKPKKGNSTVIVDKDTILKRYGTWNFLGDKSKFQCKNLNFLNFITSQEKHITKIYKKLADSNTMSEETRRHPKPVGTRHGTMYGSCVNGCSPFRPTGSTLQTPRYKIAKYLVPIIEPRTNTQSKIQFTWVLKL